MVSAGTSPRVANSGKSIALSRMPPNTVPKAWVDFWENARTEYSTPSRRMPVSSSCSSATSASIELALAPMMGAQSAPTVDEAMKMPKTHGDPFSGNHGTSRSRRQIGTLTAVIQEARGSITAMRLSSSRVRAGISTNARGKEKRPTKAR